MSLLRTHRRRSVALPPERLEQRTLMSLTPTGSTVELDPADIHWSLPSVSIDADGDFVAAWDVTVPNGGGEPGNFWSLFWPEVQRYDRFGNPVGDVIRPDDRPLRSESPDGQGLVDRTGMMPSVATDDAGNFVVAWTASNDAGVGSILARRYTADGQPRGPLFEVKRFSETVPTAKPLGASVVTTPVAMNGRGDFAFAWMEPRGIMLQRYDAAGQALGGPVEVSGANATVYTPVSLAIDDAGDVAVTWGERATSLGGSGGTVFVRHFRPDGQPAGALKVVSSGANAVSIANITPIAMDADGDTVVTWTDSRGAFWGRRYSATGQEAGAPIRFAEPAAGFRASGGVALEADGDMVVSWGEVNDGTGENRIYYQQYTAAGAPAGGRVMVLDRGDTAALHQGNTFVVAVDDPGDNALLVYLSDDARPNTFPGPDEDYTGLGHGVVRHLGADASAPFGANQAPVAGRIADVMAQGVQSSAVPLFPAFSDDRDADASLKLAVSGSTNEALFSDMAIDPATGVLTLTYAPGQVGQAIVVVTATDTAGLTTKLLFNVKVQAGPTVVPNPSPAPTPNPTPEPQPQPAPVPGEPPALPSGTGILVGRLMQKTAGAKRRKAPAAGVAVFLDADADGVKDANEPTATTGADGSYAFTGLGAGRYQVRVGGAGWQVATRKARKPRAVLIRALQRRPARVKPILLVQAPMT